MDSVPTNAICPTYRTTRSTSGGSLDQHAAIFIIGITLACYCVWPYKCHAVGDLCLSPHYWPCYVSGCISAEPQLGLSPSCADNDILMGACCTLKIKLVAFYVAVRKQCYVEHGINLWNCPSHPPISTAPLTHIK